MNPKRRRWRAEPRPLAVQRLADELVGNTHGRKPICRGLHRVHLGAICDALTAAGIDPAVWSARAIKDALETDMRTRGGTWPDRITNPGAFLASRLRRLSWTPPKEPKKASGYAAASSIDQAPRPVVLTDAARAVIAARQEEIRQILTARSQRASMMAAPTTRPKQRRRASVERMPTPTPHGSRPSGEQATDEHLRTEDGYAQLSAVFNTETANAERRAARDIYARRCEP